jgi:predicted RNase H-like nuclease (RuvC/YqgF family)
MNEPIHPSRQPPEKESHAASTAPATRTLSVALRENGDAVQEDLRQANELAAKLAAQLAGKSKELLHLKFLLEQMKSNFGHLQDSVVAMRAERHTLANECMRAQALDVVVARLTAERDRLKNELDGVLEGLAAEAAEKAQQALRFDKRDHMIAELTFELMTLRKEVVELRRMHQHPAPGAPRTPANEEPCTDSGMEIVPTAQVGGKRG